MLKVCFFYFFKIDRFWLYYEIIEENFNISVLMMFIFMGILSDI